MFYRSERRKGLLWSRLLSVSVLGVLRFAAGSGGLSPINPSLASALLALAEDVRAYPDAYLHEHAARFGVVPNAIFEALRRLGVSYKKSAQTSQVGRRKAAQLP